MKVLFVHSEEDNFSTEKPLEGLDRVQFGISYISSLLKREGHETRLVVPTRENDGIVDEHVRDFNPGLICFTSVFTAVSYTHLRAHETRHDLVCRLLLEKKK